MRSVFRFSPFFQGLSYYSTFRVVQVNTNVKTARFSMDFNYDIVMNKALLNSTSPHDRFVNEYEICQACHTFNQKSNHTDNQIWHFSYMPADSMIYVEIISK